MNEISKANDSTDTGLQIGVITLGEFLSDPRIGKKISAQQRLKEIVAAVRLADEAGLDVFGVGEHHSLDFVVSAVPVVLAAIAQVTKRIRLASAVTVLSTSDPVREFENFATLDLLSDGRAEMIAGRGAFTESFSLFGYDMADYDRLFPEKLDLLLKLNSAERVTWKGHFRPALDNAEIAPRPLKKRNNGERTSGQLPLTVTVIESLDDLRRWVVERARQLNAMPEDNATQVQQKSEAYQQLSESENFARRKLEYDLWTAAFFWRISAPETEMNVLAPTQSELAKLRRGEKLNPDLVRQVQALADRLRFFHWELEFPEVFEQGGFDANLSNPPWERIKFEEQEFFASRQPEIAKTESKNQRQKLIDSLAKMHPRLAQEHQNAVHDSDAEIKFLFNSGRFHPSQAGDINTYSVFAEMLSCLVSGKGYAGLIIPTGIATDDLNKEFFSSLMQKGRVVSLFDFENRKGLFPGVHRSYRFCLFTLCGDNVVRFKKPRFAFSLSDIYELKDERRVFTLSFDDFSTLNPNTFTCPVFRTTADATLTKKIYRGVPVFVNKAKSENSWNVFVKRVYDMNSPATLRLCTQNNQVLSWTDAESQDLVPMYEAKHFWQFDHRLGSYDGVKDRGSTHLPKPSLENYSNPDYRVKPWYWIDSRDVRPRLEGWTRDWLFGYRDITNATNERTVVASILPFSGTDKTVRLLLVGITDTRLLGLLADFNSLVFDYVARQFISGLHLSEYIVQQLPVLPPTAYTPADVEFIAPRVLDLVYTAWDMKPFAEDMGYHGEPFRWDEERRAHLRAELDAYYARLYGLTRDELRYILDPKDVYGDDFPGETFRVLKEKEIKQYGEYRTRRLVMEKWDGMNG